ncbi:MAG: molybdate ABC transporter substrate-binding protein [Candidatus Thiodiazotropha sp.]
MRILKSIALSSLIGLTLLGAEARAQQVTIAVAANFTEASREIAARFEKATGHTTKISYGSTGKLYSQIEFGAPFEVFLAADTQRPSKAEEAGLAVPGSRFVYARGKLVLWSAKPDRFESGESFLRAGEFEHVALANPKTAPYGLAAKQVMLHLGVLEQLTPKLVQGDSVAQTFQFAATANADAGFVALSQTRSWKGDRGTLWRIPVDYYASIEQAAVLLKKGETNPAAAAYLEFLKSDAAREVIERFGYGVE